MKSEHEITRCKLCGSDKIIRFGIYHGIQRWWCKDCRHKFAANNAVPNMKTPFNQVSSAIEMYYNGISMNQIPALIYSRYGAYITHTAVFQWVSQFSLAAVSDAFQTGVQAGDDWIIDKTKIKNWNHNSSFQLIDVIDFKTRFLLATQQVDGNDNNYYRSPIESAIKRAGKQPRSILFKEKENYAFENGLTFDQFQIGIPFKSLKSGEQQQFTVYWSRITGNRNKVINGIKKQERMQLMLDGWSVHYNYFKPQIELNGNTAAECARAEYKFKRWSDVIQNAGLINKYHKTGSKIREWVSST